MFGPWACNLGETERIARLREWRALATILCGSRHPLTLALAASIADPAAAILALTQLDALPTLRRRRLLSAAAALGVSPPLATPRGACAS
jgi:hypothetical protein